MGEVLVNADSRRIGQLLIGEAAPIPACLAESQVQDVSGLYAIFVGYPSALPASFERRLTDRRTSLIYIGKAGAASSLDSSKKT